MRSATLSSKLKAAWRNFKRFWPMPAVYFIIVALILQGKPDPSEFDSYAWDFTYIECLASVLFGFGCSLVLFGDLFRSRLANWIHSLPVTRTGLFAEKLLAGLVLLLVPMAAIMILALAYGKPEQPLFWLFQMGIMWLHGLSCGTLGMMMAGNTLGALAVFGFLMAGIPAGEVLLRNVLSFSVAGIDTYTTISSQWFPLFRIDDFHTGTGGITLVWTALASVLGLILSLLLYRKRKLETAGDFMSFGWANALMKFLITAMGGLALGLLVAGINGWNTFGPVCAIWLIPSVLLARMGAEIVTERTVRIFRKNQLVQYGVCLLICAAFLGFAQWDICGLEEKVPSPDEIQSVEIRGNRYGKLSFSSPESIEKITAIHRDATQNLDHYSLTGSTSSDETDSSLYLNYTKKNGSTFSRNYRFVFSDPQDPFLTELQDFFNTPGWYLSVIMGEESTRENAVSQIRFAQVSPILDRYTDDFTTQVFTGPQMEALLDAVLEDAPLRDMDYMGGYGYYDDLDWFELTFMLEDDGQEYANIILSFPASADFASYRCYQQLIGDSPA